MKEYQDFLLILGASGLLGTVIAGTYRLSHSRAVLSSRMATSLVIYAVIPAMMLYLKFNVGGIAIIGAITLMRFREPVKDHRDFAYIFWAVTSGFACAAHQFFLVGAASCVLILVLMGTGALRKEGRLLLVVRGDAQGEEALIEMFANQPRNTVKMKYNNSVEDSYMELIYEICEEEENRLSFGQKLKEELYQMEAVQEVNLFYQQDDMGI
ncbi:MAG: DUF4956 domain-containing protein [Roseburia sp.]